MIDAKESDLEHKNGQKIRIEEPTFGAYEEIKA